VLEKKAAVPGRRPSRAMFEVTDVAEAVAESLGDRHDDRRIVDGRTTSGSFIAGARSRRRTYATQSTRQDCCVTAPSVLEFDRPATSWNTGRSRQGLQLA